MTPRSVPFRFLALAAALALGAVLLAGCGSGDDSEAASTQTTAAPATTPGNGYGATGNAATVSVADNPTFGKLLTGPDGRTLYLFEKDKGTTSACAGPCLDNWPPLTSASAPTAGDGVDASKLSTADGAVANQVVYNGHLLYYFAGDKAPGDVNGANIPAWYPVNPAGDKIDRD